MAQITWRNVDSPDFRGAIQGYQAFSNLLGNALDSANSGIDLFEGQKDSRVNDALRFELAKIQASAPDEATARQRISGLLGNVTGSDKGRITADTYEAFGNLPVDILDRAVKSENFDQTKYTNQRGRDTNARLDAAAPFIADVAAASASGDQGRLQAALDRAIKGSGLNGTEILDLASKGQGLEAGAIANTGGRIGNAQSSFNYNTGVEDRNLATQAAALRQKALYESGGDPAALERVLNQYQGKIDPRVIEAARSGTGLGNSIIPAGGPAAGAAGPTPAGLEYTGGSAYNTVLGHGEFGLPNKPVTQMTVGEAIDFGRNQLIPASRGNAKYGLSQGQGSSAIGAYQFTQATLKDYAPKVLGKDWQSQPMTPQNQDKLAEAIFNDRKNGNLKDTWASLPDARPGAYKNTSWADMRQIIAQGETSQQLPQVPVAAQVTPSAQRGAEPVFAQSSLITNYQDTFNDTRPAGEVAKTLRANDPQFEGIKDTWIFNQIQDIQNRARRAGQSITASTASQILKDSMETQGFFEGLVKSGDWTVNDDKVDQAIELIGSNKFGRAVNRVASSGQAIQNIAATEQAVSQAQAALKSGIDRGLSPARIQQLEAELAKARSLNALAKGQAAGDPGIAAARADAPETGGNFFDRFSGPLFQIKRK